MSEVARVRGILAAVLFQLSVDGVVPLRAGWHDAHGVRGIDRDDVTPAYVGPVLATCAGGACRSYVAYARGSSVFQEECQDAVGMSVRLSQGALWAQASMSHIRSTLVAVLLSVDTRKAYAQGGVVVEVIRRDTKEAELDPRTTLTGTSIWRHG